MSDIINRAKQLFENRYHDEPWLALFDSSQERFWVETDNFAEVCGDFVSEDDTRLAAAAPELAQALAEETYEYSYQELRGDEWETAFNDVTHLEEWWPKKSDVDWIVEEARKHGYVCRLVRRRVSPPEVINE